MSPSRNRAKSTGFVELAAPQILDDKWREFTFDLAGGQNILQDFVTSETAAGYVYRDANQVGTATHNRFIYWKTANDTIELIELSSEVPLEDNQVRIRFVNSPVVNDVKVIEFSEMVVIVLATLTSVHRLYLPHPKLTNKSILSDLTSDVIFNPSSYFILSNHNSQTTEQPICSTAWYDKSTIKCALSFPDSSILIVQFGHQTHHITTSEIKQTGIIGRLWSRMPNLWAKSPNECDNAVFACVALEIEAINDVLLFTLCRDCRVRVFSTSTRECICSYNMIPQTSFHQSFSAHTSPATELPSIKIFKSQVVIYLSDEFIFLSYDYNDGQHELKEGIKIPAPSWEKMIDFTLNNERIWALGSSEAESTLYYMDLDNVFQESQGDVSMMVESMWNHVGVIDDICHGYVAEIFWSNRFSVQTVQKALIGISGPSVPKKNSMEELEELAATRIIDGDQEEAWTRFYNYCLQNHQTASKNIGLLSANDGSIITILRRNNPSYICPTFANFEDRLPYRGLEIPHNMRTFMKPLNIISTKLFDEQLSNAFEQQLFEDPAQIMAMLDVTVQSLITKLNTTKEHFATSLTKPDTSQLKDGLDFIINSLDLGEEARLFNEKMLNDLATQMRSEHKPLGSHSGIILTYELFKQLVRARMVLARDMLIYLVILQKYAELGKADETIGEICEEICISGRLRSLLDCLRAYSVLVWIAENPIKNSSAQVKPDVINLIARHFRYFKTHRESSSRLHESSLDQTLQQHLLTSFLSAGGVNFTWSLSQISQDAQTLSGSHYLMNTVLNLCKLLWPVSDHLCIAEFLYTQQLDEHLAKYLIMTQDWFEQSDTDRHFLRALNSMLQNRATQGVDILNRLWMKISSKNLIGRFLELELDDESSFIETTNNPELICRYYDKLIQLFEAYNNRQCLVMLIQHCMSLIDENSDYDQQIKISSLRAKLFQYYLELEDSDEAYHTMVLTSDTSLRTNCLRKFIVSHCEKKQWTNLLSYPYIDIKSDFIEILKQKAENMDLSHLNEADFYKTTYYDLLFASFISDEDYKSAAEIMYNYSRRLAQEVPGFTSIKKQSDCLLVALNALRCVEEDHKFLTLHPTLPKEKGRTGILKRSHDSEPGNVKIQSEDVPKQPADIKIYCRDIEQKYELTRARLNLLEKDQTGNAIALSPLKPEETIAQLVASSMYSAALDLSLLFGLSMDQILEGLTNKYTLIMRLSAVDLAVHNDIEKSLSDIFTSSYSNIDTYNFVANSSSPLVDRLWRLIDYYLTTYDGVSHKYRGNRYVNTFGGTTVLMRVVANRLLSAGYDIPASLKRRYFQRNTSELLKLLIKYDKLNDAADLAFEMLERLREPTNRFISSSQCFDNRAPPVYLPTHLILALITYLREDATNIQYLKTAKIIEDKLEYFRKKTCQDVII